MTDKTATERLRELLDERGVEWWPMHDDEAGYRDDRDTEFLVYGCKHVAHEWGCRLQVDMLTPAQAIAATLGSGTCKMEQTFIEPVEMNGYYQEWRCLECDEFTLVGSIYPDEKPKYCSNCGRKVSA